jgi:hypothetical protein
VPADAVTLLTTARIQIAYGLDELAAAEEHSPAER